MFNVLLVKTAKKRLIRLSLLLLNFQKLVYYTA